MSDGGLARYFTFRHVPAHPITNHLAGPCPVASLTPLSFVLHVLLCADVASGGFAIANSGFDRSRPYLGGPSTSQFILIVLCKTVETSLSKCKSSAQDRLAMARIRVCTNACGLPFLGCFDEHRIAQPDPRHSFHGQVTFYG